MNKHLPLNRDEQTSPIHIPPKGHDSIGPAVLQGSTPSDLCILQAPEEEGDGKGEPPVPTEFCAEFSSKFQLLEALLKVRRMTGLR
jgi:hypothetical protein